MFFFLKNIFPMAAWRNSFGMVHFWFLSLCVFVFTSCSKGDSGNLLTPTSNDSEWKGSLYGAQVGSSESVTEAILIDASVDPTPLFSQNLTQIMTSMSDLKPAKLICVVDSLGSFGFIVENFEIYGHVQGNTLYIGLQEDQLLRQCQHSLFTKNMNFKIAKLGIQFNGRDFELKNTLNTSNVISITSEFINSIVTPNINATLYCGDKVLTSSQDNPLSLQAKIYFDSKLFPQNNILFINSDSISIQNFGSYFVSESGKKTFLECKDHLSAVVNDRLISRVYFVEDTIGLKEDEKFFVQPASVFGEGQAYLVCYFIDEFGKLRRHWGIEPGKEISKTLIPGVWNQGVFESSLNKKELQSKCTNSYSNYNEGIWKLSKIEASENFWSSGSPVLFAQDK